MGKPLKIYRLKMDFWKAPTGVGVFTDVMVGPDFLTAMSKFLNENGFDYKITIDDVQRYGRGSPHSLSLMRFSTNYPIVI